MTKKGDFPKLLEINEVAGILNGHTETLRWWDREGRLKAVRVGSGKGVGDR